jgi:Uma2 family endonuclease
VIDSRRRMTVEEFLALEDDGISRELIRGSLRERGPVIHGILHSLAMAEITWQLGRWLDLQPKPRGELFCGECGFFLRGSLTSPVGIDVAYVSAELRASTAPGEMFFEGPPVLAVEILEETDSEEDVAEKIELYLEFGIVVWIADPSSRSIRVHQPGLPSETFNESQELNGDPYLPGFRVSVARLFE